MCLPWREFVNVFRPVRMAHFRYLLMRGVRELYQLLRKPLRMKNGKCRESDLSTSSYFTSDPMRAKPERLIECLLSSEADI